MYNINNIHVFSAILLVCVITTDKMVDIYAIQIFLKKSGESLKGKMEGDLLHERTPSTFCHRLFTEVNCSSSE